MHKYLVNIAYEKINIIEKGGEFKLLYNDYNYWIIRKHAPNLRKLLLLFRKIIMNFYSKVNLLIFPCERGTDK